MRPRHGWGLFRTTVWCLGAMLGGLSLVAQSTRLPSATPVLTGDGWQRETSADAGFDAARLMEILTRRMDGGVNLHCVIVERHGKLVAELYRRGQDRTVNSLFSHSRDFGPSVRHDARSVGKSVIGLLAGIAQSQGKLKGVDTPVLDFYPEYPELATPQRRAITLEHLLSMSSGLQWHEGGEGPDDEHKLMWKWTPVYHFLSRPMFTTPGKAFTYNSGGALAMADILTRTTGLPWWDYARTVLFEPLGITDVEWVRDFLGRPMAYTGLRLRPRDMAKLGRLVLNHGQWQGRQIVPAAWIDASLVPRLDTGFDSLHYGYFWWTGTVTWQGRSLPWAAAFGNGGQRMFVVPGLDLCVVVTAGAYGELPVARLVNHLLQDIVATISR